MSGSAGRDWRDIDVVDVEREMGKIYLDGEDFKMRVSVGEIINVQRHKFNVMTDKDGKATPTTTDTITPKKCIARKRRVRIVLAKFSLLHTCNFDVVFV